MQKIFLVSTLNHLISVDVLYSTITKIGPIAISSHKSLITINFRSAQHSSTLVRFPFRQIAFYLSPTN